MATIKYKSGEDYGIEIEVSGETLVEALGAFMKVYKTYKTEKVENE